MYYLIKDKLEEATYEECLKRKYIYVATVDKEEFKRNSELFNMGIDMIHSPAVFPYLTEQVFPMQIMSFRLPLTNRVLFL